MDAFENVVAEILWRGGYWVRQSFKVELTKEDKVAIGRPSSPRWELDILAFGGKRNEVIAVECKSYLDSPGVRFRAFNGTNEADAERFKLFNDTTLRTVVFGRLQTQLIECGLLAAKPTVKLALACGKIVRDADRNQLKQYFAENDWLLWDEVWLQAKLKEMAKGGYENSSVAVVAKLILRGQIGG